MPTFTLSRLRRESPLFAIALVVFALVLVALVHVHLHLSLIQAGYAVSRETQRRHQLEEQHQKLRLELAMRRDPAAVERTALGTLGLRPPAPEAIRALDAAAPPSSGSGNAALQRSAAPALPREVRP